MIYKTKVKPKKLIVHIVIFFNMLLTCVKLEGIIYDRKIYK